MEQHLETLYQLVREFGISSQEKKLLEEMEELKKVILDPHKKTKQFYRHLTDEVADVLILLYQIIAYYRLETVVDTMVDYKIQRTIYEKEQEDE